MPGWPAFAQQGAVIAISGHHARLVVAFALAAGSVLAAAFALSGWRAAEARAIEAARDGARATARRIADDLQAAIAREQQLIQLLAAFGATGDWLRAEADPRRRQHFVRDAEPVRARLRSGAYVIIHHGSRRYYQVTEGRLARATLDPARAADAGYFALMESIGALALRVAPGPVGDPGKLWISVPVRDGDVLLGLLSTGMPLQPVLDAAFARDGDAIYVDADGGVPLPRAGESRRLAERHSPADFERVRAALQTARTTDAPGGVTLASRDELGIARVPATGGFVIATVAPQRALPASSAFAIAAACACALLAVAAFAARRRAPPVAAIDPIAVTSMQGAGEDAMRTTALLTRSGHEIRTPMNALVGMCRLALKSASDPQQRRHLERALAAADDLSRTAAGIIDLAKIEAGEFVLEQRPFDLRELLPPLCDVIAQRADAVGVTVAFRIAAGVPLRLVGDAFQFGQVLVHLAVHAIAEDCTGEATIALHVIERDDRRVRLGIEIAAPHGDVPGARGGIGLAIGRMLLAQMDGAIDADGASVRLAVAADAEPANAAIVLRAERPGAAAEAIARSLAQIAGAHVLVVDDNAINREVALDVLSEFPVRVTVVEDGRQAVQQVVAGDFDLVLMDLQMPVLDGHAATREIRALGHRLPIVAMTAHDLASDRLASRAAGMDDHLSKPVDPLRLRRVLLQWIDPARVRSRVHADASAHALAAPALDEGAMHDFDWHAALERVNRNPVLLSRLLRNFRQDYAGAAEQLRGALANGELAEIRALAHGLKSSAAYLGAVELSALASRVEKAIRAEQTDEAAALVPHMIAGLDAVLAGIATSATEHPPAPQDADLARSSALIQRLTELLWAADARAEDALDELEAALGESHLQAVEAIRESIVEVEYDVALLQLSTLASAMNLTLERAP